MIYEVNSNDPKEGILMSDKNNNVMMNNDMNNNMNNDNDPKERMRKKVKKAAGIALCAITIKAICKNLYRICYEQCFTN